MLNSLRFRLPALFLAGIALSGLVTSLIALRLFQDYTRDASLNELRREAQGLAQLYAESAVRAVDEEKAAPTFAAAKLEAATGDRLYFVGASLSRRVESSRSSSGRRARTGRFSRPHTRSGRAEGRSSDISSSPSRRRSS